MEVFINISLDEYVEIGDKNTRGMLAGHHELMADVRAFYDFFATKLWADMGDIPEVPMFLSTNALMLWTSAIRMAMSGHEAAVYPLLRTSLESACYALLICRKPELAPIWASRHDSESQLKEARKAFRPAIANLIKIVEAEDLELSIFVSELYEASIDFGAHPNPLGIMRHVQTTSPTKEQTRYNQGSIYPGDSFPVFRALGGGIEFGVGIAYLLAKCRPNLTDSVVAGLKDLEARRTTLSSHPDPVEA